MSNLIYANDEFQVIIGEKLRQDSLEYFVEKVRFMCSGEWKDILFGQDGGEFSTSFGSSNASEFKVLREDRELAQLYFSCRMPQWEAKAKITIDFGNRSVERVQTYRFLESCAGSIHPGWKIYADPVVRYTYPLHCHDAPLFNLAAMRTDIAWALPMPFHVWHNREWVAIYGVDKGKSAGTIDYSPVNVNGYAGVRVFYPESTKQDEGFSPVREIPEAVQFQAGTELTLTDIFMIDRAGEQEPLLKAEKMAASRLLEKKREEPDLIQVANGIADFYNHCDLWDPDALGVGRGWFLNMWMYTQAGEPKKRGIPSGFYDMGWGEGIACEIVTALTRNWRRTGRTDLLHFIDEMTESFELFKRGPEEDAPYYDRSDGNRFGDFGMDKLVWSHSLGHTGCQLIRAYIDNPDYPRQDIRSKWLVAARSMALFFAKHQQQNGDICDIFDTEDREVNKKPHRIAARAVVCGLWTHYAEVSGDSSYIDKALRLADCIAPEIRNYEIFNQMIDGLGAEHEFMDGEAAYYILEGLVPLYGVTRKPELLPLCEKAVAFGVCWTYFYDLPNAHNSIARGGQACRMPDYPLLYPIGPAKATEPLIRLFKLTGDDFYRQMAEEMVAFIGHYQFLTPGKPWHGGIIHAIGQHDGKHWGPKKCGQIDCGMATGNSLAAVEYLLEYLLTENGTEA